MSNPDLDRSPTNQWHSSSTESEPDAVPLGKTLSRREFLRLLASALFGLGAGALSGCVSNPDSGQRSLEEVCSLEYSTSEELLRAVHAHLIKNFRYDQNASVEWSLPPEFTGDEEIDGNCKDFAIKLAIIIFGNEHCKGKFTFGGGFLFTQYKDEQDPKNNSAHLGLLVYCKESEAWYLLDNGPYGFNPPDADIQRGGLIYLGQGQGINIYERFEHLSSNGKPVTNAFVVGGGFLENLNNQNLALLHEAMNWNKVYSRPLP